jgi:hypothetical protein
MVCCNAQLRFSFIKPRLQGASYSVGRTDHSYVATPFVFFSDFAVRVIWMKDLEDIV